MILRIMFNNLLNYSPVQYAYILINQTSDETFIKLSEFLHMLRGKELLREDFNWF